ncbi:MAG: CapA family protein [bacterium]|nr:MAG: CapA family protein [bacterium]
MESNRTMRFVFVGDLMFNREFLLPPNDDREPEYYFSGVRDLFHRADIAFCNLESTLLREGSPLRPRTGFQLHSPPDKMIPILEYLNINVISLGNNHMDDFGAESLLGTKRLLIDNGFSPFGVGETPEDARKPMIVNKYGTRIAFLGYTTNTAGDGISPDIGSAIATVDAPGCNYYAIEDIRKDISSVKEEVDILCVSLHWGYEYFHYPSPRQVELAHRIIESGADIIIGHHPHCLQGIEHYREGVILYSIGNFFFFNYYKRIGHPLYGNDFIIAICEVTSEGITVDFIPGEMDKGNSLHLLQKRDEFDRLLAEYSGRLNDLDYSTFWQQYKEETEDFLQNIALEHASTIIRSPADIPAILRKIKEQGFSRALERLKYKLRAKSRLEEKRK